MRKILLSLSVLLSTVCAWAQVADLEALKAYDLDSQLFRLKNTTTSLYMTVVSPEGTNVDAGGVQIKALTAGDFNQIFYIQPTGEDGEFKIKSVNNHYLQWFGAWGYKATATDSDNSKHTIEEVEENIFKLKTSKGYVGSNNGATTDGSHMYSNHDANKANIKWAIEALTEEEYSAVEAVIVANLKESYTTQKNTISVGAKVGQYTVDLEALASAEAELNSATTIAAANAAIAKCKKACVLNTPVVGKYYRIKNTKHGTYAATDSMNVMNKAEDAEDPSQIWLLEKEGEKLYLKNVYTGLYVQYIPDGGNNTATVGISKNYAFTYKLHTEAVKDGADASWNIFFGGRQVNIEENGNFNYWYQDGAHHNIYEIEKTDEELATMCVNWYNADPINFTTEVKASDYAKIDIDEKATVVISPSEFAAPSVINSTIDKLDAAISLATNALAEVTMENIHSKFEAIGNVSKYVSDLNAYKNAVTNYGELLSIAYTPVAEWGTIILPINWSKPEGWTRYTCAATEGNVLTLTDFADGGATKNTPMIIHFEDSVIGTTYQLIGYSNGAGTKNVTIGLLTGVLENDTNVPAGSYVLSNYNDQIGFYPVATGATYPATKYMCYLTLPPASARYAALFFEGGETAIESIQGVENANAVVYDLAGRRVQGAQKGLYIVNGKKVVK